MKQFGVIEIGSTNTKAYICTDNAIKTVAYKTIEFKNHYKKEGKIIDEDKESLYDIIKKVECKDIYVFGTSIFRNLSDQEKNGWFKEFKEATGLDFRIVSSDLENEYTVYGAISNTNYEGNIAVMIGGGGSTELSIVNDGKIIEKANSSFGAMDVTDMFPELRTDYAKTDYDEMVEETKKLVNIPKNKASKLILAGGDYIYFYEELKYPIIKNTFTNNELEPYMLDVATMDKLDRDFFYNISLEEVCKRTNNDGWWRGARGMRLCVKALVDILGVEYIIPTRINMVYGIVEKIKKGEIK